jgi:membrane protein DedA with SNARE-associated domain
VSFELLVSLFIQYGYWIVFVGILLDNAGLPLPGELLLLSFGALARTGHVDLGLGILVAAAAAMSGDSVGYWLGRLGGERLIHTYCRVTLGSGKCVQKAVAFYYSHGKMAVVFGRFVMGVRAFLFPLAGSVRMPYSRFLLFDSVGALVWAGLFILAGYSVGWQVHDRYRAASMIVAGTLGAGVAGYFLTKLYRRWRHGPASLRRRLIARVGKALQSGPGLRTVISKPSEMVRVGSNGTGQTNQRLFPGEDGGASREAQARRNPKESPAEGVGDGEQP